MKYELEGDHIKSKSLNMPLTARTRKLEHWEEELMKPIKKLNDFNYIQNENNNIVKRNEINKVIHFSPYIYPEMAKTGDAPKYKNDKHPKGIGLLKSHNPSPNFGPSSYRNRAVIWDSTTGT